MNRKDVHTAIAAALFATLAMAGCKKHDETPAPPATDTTATTPPPPTTTPAPAPAPVATTLSVTTVDLGNSIGADNRIATPMTSFGTKDTIHASVATDGPGGDLVAKWTMGDKVVDTQNKTVPAGPQVTEFSITKPSGWPAGHYKLDVQSAGTSLQTREFDIK
ncbi:MAG: hypothetical protein JWL98_991 [Xanthomonadaceae bacterium]|nr:hypothetical protein [Xanthomonadaceae bacterium]